MFKLLIIIILIFFLLGKLIKYVIKYAFLNAMQKQGHQGNQADHRHKKNGDIHVDYSAKNSDKNRNVGGEYIDYEVIK